LTISLAWYINKEIIVMINKVTTETQEQAMNLAKSMQKIGQSQKKGAANNV